MSLAATMLGSYTVGHAAGAICVSGRGRSQVSNAVRPGKHVEVLSRYMAFAGYAFQPNCGMHGVG